MSTYNVGQIIKQIRTLCPNKSQSFSIHVPFGENTMRLAMEVSIDDDNDLIADLDYESIEDYYLLQLSQVAPDGDVIMLGTIHADQFFDVGKTENQGQDISFEDIFNPMMDVLNQASVQ